MNVKTRFDAVMNECSIRTRYSFVVGTLALSLVFALWIGSRSTDGWTSPAEEEHLAISTGTFAAAGSLYIVLRKASIAPAETEEIARALKAVFNPRGLQREDIYEIQQGQDGTFQQLTITRALQQYIVAKSTSALLSAFTRVVPVQSAEKLAAGSISSSLWETLRGKDLPPEVIMQFADIFAWNMDFLTECREGDRFALVYAQDVTPSGMVAKQRIAAALYEGRATGRHLAFLFDGEYYDEEGSSLRKAFLHAPLNFRRISSGFSRKRFHPILRYFRPHLGIDYAAPRGTPVVAVGDGTVVFKGWKTAYGKYVQLRHNGTYTTCYGHLAGFAKTLRRGAHVRQGQVIGYVGSTGYSTGPHLDFRVLQNNRFVNFLKLKFPPDRKVPRARQEEFQRTVEEGLERLQEKLQEEIPSVS